MNRPTFFRTAAWIAVIGWCITIFILSSLPGPTINEINVLNVWDKAAHAIAFAAGAVVLAIALRISTAWSWKKIALVAAVAVSLFGATDEWHQLYTPKRSGADPADWLADTIGAVAGVAATSLVYARFERKNHTPPPRA